ncbi:swr1 complex component [Coemansia sp. BCRC 34490]|nr:swr1 complex component [Coemansia sp. BCRC 34490]
MSTAGHNGRGRRRGRPPGVRAGRSAAKSTHASLKRTMPPQPSESPPPPPPTKSARIAGSVDVADENAHSDLGSAEDLNGSGGIRRLSGAAVASISGTGGRRKRGRPPRLAKTTRSVAGDQENMPSSLRSSDSNTYTLCNASSPAPGSASGGGSQIGAPSSLLVDPMLFVQNAVSQGHTPNIRDTKKLSDYLCSSITLPDDTVLTALPPRLKQPLSSAAVKRDRNAMTVPEPLPSIVKKDHKGTRNQRDADDVVSRSVREKKMKADLDDWVQSMAETMNRISVLRRSGMLRDSVSVGIQTTDALSEQTTQNQPKPVEPHRFDYSVGSALGLTIPVLPPPLPEPAPRVKEPQRAKTWWDQLIVDAIDRHKELTMLSRRRKAVLRKRSKQIEREDDERKAKLGIFKSPEQADRALRELHKRLAKWTVQQVMRKWSYMESIIDEQRQVEKEEEKAEHDKRLLFDMLHRSTRLLEDQRAANDISASSSSAESDDDDDDSSEAGSDVSSGDEHASSAMALGYLEPGDSEGDGSDLDGDAGRRSLGLRDLFVDQTAEFEELQRKRFRKMVAEKATESVNRQGKCTLAESATTEGHSATSDNEEDDSDAVISSEQSDTEFSSESSEDADSDHEMLELQRDQSVPMDSLLDQYYQREQEGMIVEPEPSLDEPESEQDTIGIEHLAGPSKPEHTIAQPFLLRGNLREYQRQGLDWLASLHQHNINGILADEMGLGKTIQTIALLAHLACDKGIWGPHLVIVPTSVLLNWEQEFHRWLPGFKVLSYYGGRAERKLKRKGWSKRNAFHVCITSYQLAIQDASIFKRKPWYYMILDEAQAIKNFRSQRWQTLLGFKSSSRLLLTGTPLQNSLIELWSLMYFLMPERLGQDNGDDGDMSGFAELDHFREWFSQPLEKLLAAQPDIAAPVGSGGTGNVEFNTSLFLQGSGVAASEGQSLTSSARSSSLCTTQTEAQQAVQKLHTVLRPHILRRLKQDVETQLPNKVEHVIYCHLSKRQRFLYDDFMSRSQTRETLHSGTYLNVMSCLMQLRKVCNHPDLFETRPIVTSWVMPGFHIASYGRTETLVRRMLLQNSAGCQDRFVCTARKPWQEDSRECMSSWGLRGLVRTGNEQLHDHTAWCRAKDLDATPDILRLGLLQANKGLEVVATREQSWEDLQMRPVVSHYTRVEENVRHQKWLDAARSQDAWMRLVRNNQERIGGLAFCPIYGASTLQACRAASGLNDGIVSDNLVLTGKQRLELFGDTIANFVCITPPVVVANEGSDLEAVWPHLRPSSSPGASIHSWVSREQRPTVLHMHRRVARHTGPMRPIEVRQQIAFPEPFLLQYDCGKLQALGRLLGRLVREGHRALIFTQMTKVLDILEKWLSLHGYRYLRLDGATKVEQRWRLTERFNHDSKWKVFISSTRAGGLGINLTGADTVIFYDSDWNHAMDAQCQDRCHRIGQQREVHIYRLISESTIEEAIWRKQCEKRWLNQVVIQEGRFDPNADAAATSKHAANKALQQQQQQQQDGGGGPGLNVGDWYDLASSVLAQASGSGSSGSSGGLAGGDNRLRDRRQVSEREAKQMLSTTEDAVDAAALRVAISEVAQADALDLGSEESSAVPASDRRESSFEVASTSGLHGHDPDVAATAGADPNADDGGGDVGDDVGDDDDGGIGHVDDYMFRFLMETVFN